MRSAALLATAAVAALFAAAAAAPSWSKVSVSTPYAPRGESALSLCGGDKVCLLGGRGSNPVAILDTKTLSWSEGEAPPLEIHHFQAFQGPDNCAWVVGAWTGKFPDEKNVESILKYCPDTDSWSTGPKIDRPRGSGGAFLYKGAIYLVSGNDGGHNKDAVLVPFFDRYDLATEKWSTLDNIPHPRDHFHAILIDEKLYVAGGRDSTSDIPDFFNDFVPEVDVYDFATDKWSTLTDFPRPRGGTFSTALDGKLFVMGGEGSNRAWSEVDILDGSSFTSGPDMPTRRHGTGAVTCNGAIWVAGGAAVQGGGTFATDTVAYFDGDTPPVCTASTATTSPVESTTPPVTATPSSTGTSTTTAIDTPSTTEPTTTSTTLLPSALPVPTSTTQPSMTASTTLTTNSTATPTVTPMTSETMTTDQTATPTVTPAMPEISTTNATATPTMTPLTTITGPTMTPAATPMTATTNPTFTPIVSPSVAPESSASTEATKTPTPAGTASASVTEDGAPTDDTSSAISGEDASNSPSSMPAASTEEDSGPACFPSDAVVELRDGSMKKMEELGIGDEVKVSHPDGFSAIFFFSHRHPHSVSTTIKIDTSVDGVSLSVSPGHLIYANEQLVAASSVKIGDVVGVSIGDMSKASVTRIERTSGQGLHNPHTLHGDIIVNGVVASTFTSTVHPSVAKVLLAPFRAMFKLTGKHKMTEGLNQAVLRTLDYTVWGTA